MNPLQNIIINLQAQGPAAVLIVWMLCFTAMNIFGASVSSTSIGVMAAFGGLLLGALSQKIK